MKMDEQQSSDTAAEFRFDYCGIVPASKSILNRLLVLQSFHPQLEISGDSFCDDVMHMRDCLERFSKWKVQQKPHPFLDGSDRLSIVRKWSPLVLDCGHAGTTFRFLALRLSRQTGHFFLRGSRRLLARPQEEIPDVLNQLGVQAEFDLENSGLRIVSNGWTFQKQNEMQKQWDVEVDCSRSSQFLSAVLLSAVGLEHDLRLKLVGGEGVSHSYSSMTIEVLKNVGIEVRTEPNTQHNFSTIVIPKGQAIQAGHVEAEADASSCFALAAIAAGCGRAKILNFPKSSLQPDVVFVEILRQMGADVSIQGSSLSVSCSHHSELQAISWNLRECPDLFPVLATLCAFAKGESVLSGAPHLKHKESDRILKVAALIRSLGREVEVLPDGIRILAHAVNEIETLIQWHPDSDHRLVMAAGLAMMMGKKIAVHDADEVAKSFPEYWNCLEGFRRKFVIGHRGTGKSTWAKKSEMKAADLDDEIAKVTGFKTVREYYESLPLLDRDAEFRKTEINVFTDLLARLTGTMTADELHSPTSIVFGAGFELERLARLQILRGSFFWLRRESDQAGRVFLDRPRLDPSVSAWQEWQDRFGVREARFTKFADHVLTLPEARAELQTTNDGLSASVAFNGGVRTLTPEPFKKDFLQAINHLHRELESLKSRIELRDDLLDEPLTCAILESIAANRGLTARQVVFSFRSSIRFSSSLSSLNHYADVVESVDFPLELGAQLPQELIGVFAANPELTLILSDHSGGSANEYRQRLASLQQVAGHLLARLPKLKVVLKYSPEVNSLLDLHHLHTMCEPLFSARSLSLLPRSDDGRWQWYRQLLQSQSPIWFWRHGAGSAPDQPTFLQTRSFHELGSSNLHFGAVLGAPVRSSWSPTEHADFFKSKAMAFFAIRCDEDDFNSSEWSPLAFLHSLGLRAAAVTAPLKEIVFTAVRQNGFSISDPAMRLGSVNTLRFGQDMKQAFAHNTDLEGFKFAWQKVTENINADLPESVERPLPTVAVWGGGGTLKMLAEVIPTAQFYSARTGKRKSLRLNASSSAQENEARTQPPDILIWAIGRTVLESTQRWPDAALRAEVVLDLNYAENSPGKEFAAMTKARYISGDLFFASQAAAQKIFWEKEKKP